MTRPAFIAAFTLPFAFAALPLFAVFAMDGSTARDEGLTYVPAPITEPDGSPTQSLAQKTGSQASFVDEYGCDRDVS